MILNHIGERLKSILITKKVKQLLTLTLVTMMMNPLTSYGAVIQKQEVKIISAFEKLPEEIVNQQFLVGAEESDIDLPDQLNVMIRVHSTVEGEEDNPDDNSEEGNITKNNGELPLAENTTGSVTIIDFNTTGTEQTEVKETSSQNQILSNITWQINGKCSDADTFDSSNADAVFYYEPILPEGYKLANSLTLPRIQVQIQDGSKWAFDQSMTIDGVGITVKAEKDVFPEDAVLHAKKIINEEEQKKIEDAVTREVHVEDKAKMVKALISFDITITDEEGNELQPNTSKGEVRVSFTQMPTVTEKMTSTQELKVFHMDDSLSGAKEMDTSVDLGTETVEVPANHFSVFTAILLTEGTGVTSLSGKGTEGNPYQITSAEDLFFLASQVNDKVYSNTDYFRLQTDVDFSDISDDYNWTPIGNSDETPFVSKFDGNGKMIRNLKVINTEGGNIGLFGVIDSGAEVKKIALKNVQIEGKVGQFNVGGVAGSVKGAISECYVSGLIKANYITSVGGVAGKLNQGSLSNCYADVDLQDGMMDQGGVVGEVTGGRVNNCYSTGSVQGYGKVGGVAGSISDATVSNCFATGEISASTSNSGGAIGFITGTSNINNLVALNISVSGKENIGRVVGQVQNGQVEDAVAFEGMAISPNGSSRKDGDSITTATIQADDYFKSLFLNDSAWRFETSSLPILNNVSMEQTIKLPAHLMSLAPSAPQNIKTTVGNQEVTLEWMTPTGNAAGITGYEVSNDNGSSWISAGNQLTYTFTELENGVNYVFAVRAVTENEKGAKATIEEISGRIPGEPQNLAITTFRDDDDKKRVTLTWSAPDFLGDSPITEYKVCIGSMGIFISAGNQTSYTFSETDTNYNVISWGQQQTFQVYACNSSGNGEAVTGEFDIATVPTKPQNFTATPDENGNVLLKWTEPLDMGGSNTTGYRVSKDGGKNWTTVSDELTYSFNNLPNGNAYDFEVQASNSEGWSSSAIKKVMLVGNVIFTDSNTSLLVMRKSKAECTFTATGSGAITYSLEGSIPAGVAIDSTTGKMIVDGSKSPAGSYSFSIKAIDNMETSNTKTFNLTIKKINVTNSDVVWPSASTITYGQSLKDSKLMGGSEEGIWSWKDNSIVPDVSNSGYDVVFTPNDNENYDWSSVALTQKVQLTVNPATPKALTWPTATSITYGQQLSDAAIIGGSVNGVWSWKDGDCVPSVINSGYEMVFTPNDNENYDWSNVDLTQKVQLTVNLATPKALTWPTPTSITYGQSLKDSELMGSSEEGIWSWKDNSIVPDVSNSGYDVVFTPNDENNYDWSSVVLKKTMNIEVRKASVSAQNPVEIPVPFNNVVDGEFKLDNIAFEPSAPGTSGSRSYELSGVTTTNFFSVQPAVKQNKLTYSSSASNTKESKSTVHVTIKSENYEDVVALVTFIAVDKRDAGVSFSGAVPSAKTYGDGIFTLTASAMTSGQNGSWTWLSSNSSVLKVTGKGASAEVEILKSGDAVVTSKYESDTTMGESSTATIRVSKKSLKVQPKNFSIYTGSAIPTLEVMYIGLENNDKSSALSLSSGSLEMDIKKKDGTPLMNTNTEGIYDIVFNRSPVFAESEKYDINIANGSLTIKSSGGSGSSIDDSYARENSTARIATILEKKPNQPIIAMPPVIAIEGSNGEASASISDRAVIDSLAEAQTSANLKGKEADDITVVFDITMPKEATSLTTTLTRGSLDSLVGSEIKNFEMSSSLLSLSFDQKTLTEIQNKSSGNINITVAPIRELSETAQKMIGTRPIYDMTISYGNGKTVSNFGGGVANVSVPYRPKNGEAISGIYAVYVDEKGNATRIANSSYDANSGCVIFKTSHFSQYGIGYTSPIENFTDVSTHWAKKSIDHVVGRGLIYGSTETTFQPNSAMMRGSVVTALGRLAEVDITSYMKNSFTDVKEDSISRPYIEWAYSKDIIHGVGNSQFAPDRAITREEMAVILANYAKATGYMFPITREVTSYVDDSSIDSPYREAVRIMQQAGIMVGDDNNRFNPRDNITRAEISSMLDHYIKLTTNPSTAQGWVENDSRQYLFYKDGKALSGTHFIDGIKYFFKTDGSLKTGWVSDGDNWRFYSGKTMVVGFWTIDENGNNRAYYFNEDGMMVTDKWVEIEGKWYYFYADGSLAINTKIDGYEVDKTGKALYKDQ